jgi:hypothetical protein
MRLLARSRTLVVHDDRIAHSPREHRHERGAPSTDSRAPIRAARMPPRTGCRSVARRPRARARGRGMHAEEARMPEPGAAAAAMNPAGVCCRRAGRRPAAFWPPRAAGLCVFRQRPLEAGQRVAQARHDFARVGARPSGRGWSLHSSASRLGRFRFDLSTRIVVAAGHIEEPVAARDDEDPAGGAEGRPLPPRNGPSPARYSDEPNRRHRNGGSRRGARSRATYRRPETRPVLRRVERLGRPDERNRLSSAIIPGARSTAGWPEAQGAAAAHREVHRRRSRGPPGRPRARSRGDRPPRRAPRRTRCAPDGGRLPFSSTSS